MSETGGVGPAAPSGAGPAEAGAAGEEPGSGNGAPAPKTFKVSQYNRSVERLLKTQAKTVWVQGVITQLQVRGRAAYVTLGEFEDGDAKPKAVLDVMLWAHQLEDYNVRFALLPTPFALRPELKVSFLLEPSFYVPTGRFQPKVLDVDETFTVGELSLTRRRTLERLQREGLLDRNKRLMLAEVPLRIGLITAPGSAAYNDFASVLLQSGFAFRIFLAPARMQGPATESTVAHALAVLGRMPLDCICLVRGGGSKTDLVFFDSEAICRAIALCPVPVLTGIGHEIDRSLADVVAHSDLITPTDCAKFLEGRADDAWEGLRRRTASLGESWRLSYQDCGYAVIRQAEWLRSAWENRSGRESQRQAEARRGLGAGCRRLLKAAREKLALDLNGLRRGPAKIARAEGMALELKEKLVQAADPAVLLGRGFALVFSASGRWIRGASDAVPGEEIRTRFLDGSLRSRVQSKEEEPWKREP